MNYTNVVLLFNLSTELLLFDENAWISFSSSIVITYSSILSFFFFFFLIQQAELLQS